MLATAWFTRPTGRSRIERHRRPGRDQEMAFAGGTVADIGYFDVASDPHLADGARLRWSSEITANVSAVMGNVIAHRDNNSVGCRIVVNGQVKAERISNDVNADKHCLVKGA